MVKTITHQRMQPKTRVHDDEAAVQCIEACISNWVNIFVADEKLCHIASGRIVTDDIAHDLMNAKTKSETAIQILVSERLDSSGEKDFYAPIKRMNLKSFASLDKKKSANANTQKTSVLKSTRELFGRLMVIGQSRNISLGPYPLSIATPEGNLVKTVKATLLKELEKNYVPLSIVSPDTTWIIDAMAVLQALKVDTTMTYKHLALLVFKFITQD